MFCCGGSVACPAPAGRSTGELQSGTRKMILCGESFVFAENGTGVNAMSTFLDFTTR